MTRRAIFGGYDPRTGTISLEVGALPEETVRKWRDEKFLNVDIDVPKKKRSLDANALLWACIGEIAAKTGRDKWTEYLALLKEYGKFTYVVVKKNAVEAMQAQWRETEIVGDYEVNGQPAVQMLCYFGSSTYNSKEFSVLLDGTIEAMKDLGLEPPPSGDMARALKKLEEKEAKE